MGTPRPLSCRVVLAWSVRPSFGGPISLLFSCDVSSEAASDTIKFILTISE